MQKTVVASLDHQSPPPTTRFPRRFGDRYVLLKTLGHGGMGEVFLGISGRAGIARVCALKIIRKFQADQDAEDLTQRFLDEAKVVTQLTHPNLIYVFDFGIVDRQGYLAMEYVPGKTLTEVWNRCAQRRVGFPTGVALFLISELVAALGYVHRAGGLALVHRDISPSNLMVSYSGGLKLIDFGLAKWNLKVSETATGINWGKVHYMSPEQHQGRPVDHRSDLFSAGVILWELLTGRQLFPTAEDRLRNREIPPPSTINPGILPSLDQVVRRALSVNPTQRYQTGEEMSAALAAEMPRESGRLPTAEFMERLFGGDRKAETGEHDTLVARATELGDAMPDGLSSRNEQSSRDPLVGTVLADRYYVRKWIGQGAMGRVYEGHHTGIGKRVAIKVPRNPERRKSELLGRFRREAQAASQIGHPNIADVTDCGTTPTGDFFFVMEYVDGVDLDAVVERDGPLPVDRALVIGLQIARALEAAHQVGIIHRDLKPSNVMLVKGREDADVVKVLDFGVAKFLRGDESEANATVDPEAETPLAAEADTTTARRRPRLDGNPADAAVGTPRYMAPEQIGPGHNVDFRADIYAVGGLLYFMLSGGRAPIEADNVQDVWRRKLHDDPTPLEEHRPEVPHDLDKLIMRCLARSASERPASMVALKTDLVAALEKLRSTESAMLPRRFFSRTSMMRSARQRRRLVAAAALGAGALAASASAAIWRWQSRPSSAAIAARDLSPAASLAPAAGLQSGVVSAQALAIPPTTAPATPPPVAPAPLPEELGGVAPSLPAPLDPKAAPPAPRVATATTPAPSPSAAAPRSGRPSPRQAPPQAAEKMSPAEIDRSLRESEALFQKGDPVQALLTAEKVVRRGGGSARTHLLLGKLHLGMEEYAQAVQSYKEALRLDPGNQEARRGLQRATEEMRREP